MEALERRREERIRCILGVGEINGKSCPNTFLTDISSIGAQLETGVSLEIGDAVEVGLSPSVEAPAEEGRYRLTARVAWVRASEPDPRRYRIGLRFFAPLSEATKILAKFRYRFV